MKVIMKQEIKGSNDGRNTITFIKGNEYEVPLEMSFYLANGWIEKGVCVKKEEETKPDIEEKTGDVKVEVKEVKDVEETQSPVEEKVIEDQTPEKIEEKSISNYENKMLDTEIENKAITNIDNKSNLEDLSVEELKAILKNKGISFNANTGKAKLIKKIEGNK